MNRLRVVLLGHKDHGKSTLLGRLLCETGSLAHDKREALLEASRKRGVNLEWALAVDAFQVERNQGLTVETAYVPLREYLFIDAPGHEEFLKSMISGAAAAEAALLVIDATEGTRPQSYRHAHLIKLLGIRQAVVAVNKMDGVGYAEASFRTIETSFGVFLRSLGFERVPFIPISARHGINLTKLTDSLAWYKGPPLLDLLGGFRPTPPLPEAPLRFSVQDVYERDIIVGRVESGTIHVGDQILFSPWNKIGFVRSIERWKGSSSPQAIAGESIGITLDAPLGIERGQVASHRWDAPAETDRLDAKIFWLGRQELSLDRTYTLKIATQEAPCRVEKIHRIIHSETLESTDARSVGCNQIAEVTLRPSRPVAVDDFAKLPITGRFVLMDGDIIGGGGTVSLTHSGSAGLVRRQEREHRVGHVGRVIWLTGLPGSGKSTLAVTLERKLFDQGFLTYVLDGDTLRRGLSADLGFSPKDRDENVRRTAEVAKFFCDAGLVVIVALISPRAEGRDRIRAALRPGEFIEVYVNCPLETCRERDPKGLYRAALEGRVKEMTGLDAPYEPPIRPEVEVRTAEWGIDECVDRILACLNRR